MNKCQS